MTQAMAVEDGSAFVDPFPGKKHGKTIGSGSIALQIMVDLREIIPFYGRTIQFGELL